MKLSLTPAAHRLLVRTLADGASWADHPQIEEDHLDGHARDCRELLRLVGKRAAPKKSLPGPGIRAKREARRAAHAAEVASIRAEVMARAAGRCEACRLGSSALELDHYKGGNGRRRQEQSTETCWALDPLCHRMKTANKPSRAYWDDLFATHLSRISSAPSETLPDFVAPLLEDEP